MQGYFGASSDSDHQNFSKVGSTVRLISSLSGELTFKKGCEWWATGIDAVSTSATRTDCVMQCVRSQLN